jgi:hypothetical protein
VVTYTCLAVPNTPSWWPNKPAGATRTYALDISSQINLDADLIASASAVAAPSGSGELQTSDLIVSGDTLYLTTSAGQPSRVYSIQFTVTMTDGQIYVFIVYQGVPPGLPGYAIPVPPSPGFGTPVTWIWNASFDFSNPLNSGYIALLAGLA